MVSGHTKHINIRLNFLPELKDTGMIQGDCISTDDMVAHTKNSSEKVFKKHAKCHCGDDEYWCQNYETDGGAAEETNQ